MILPMFCDLEEIITNDEQSGFCLACGNMQSAVEPDAHEYKCESCGALKVYGAQEIILMGQFEP